MKRKRTFGDPRAMHVAMPSISLRVRENDIEERQEEVRRVRQAATVLLRQEASYGKLCPCCDTRWGTSTDGFIDIERCVLCAKPQKTF